MAALPVARPVTEDALASLKAIADSPASRLPATYAAAGGGEADSLPTGDNAPAGEQETPATKPSGAPLENLANATAPASWSAPGLDPEEVNPGDLFFENEGPLLRKVMSLLDELPEAERSTLLPQFTRSTKTRLPVTLSRREIAGLGAVVEEGTELPTRSVALDCRTETHEIDPDRYERLIADIAKGDSAGAISSPDHLGRLRKQIGAAKKRLEAGETLHLVTSVSESSRIDASYPGAPVGKRDAVPVRNAVSAVYPHLRGLEADKDGELIVITGHPRIVWKFATRTVKLEEGRILVDGESTATVPSP